jgi:hypothetical protein
MAMGDGHTNKSLTPAKNYFKLTIIPSAHSPVLHLSKHQPCR